MTSYQAHRLARFRALAESAARRRRIGVWLEHLEHLERTPARTADEQLAKQEAIELLHRAYPGA